MEGHAVGTLVSDFTEATVTTEVRFDHACAARQRPTLLCGPLRSDRDKKDKVGWQKVLVALDQLKLATPVPTLAADGSVK